MFVVKKQKNEILSLPAAELSLSAAGALKSKLAQRVLAELASQEESYAAEISRRLKENEQKIYYHLRNLEAAGVLTAAQGEAGQRLYRLSKPAFVFALKEFEQTTKIAQPRSESAYLEPFISDGQLNALIIVGSPDPHGPEKARSRDGYYGIDLALFFGTFLNYVPDFRVRLDTEVRPSDLKQNLVLIGGPVVNAVTAKVNDSLPIHFDRDARSAIRSTVSGRLYPEDECGLVCSAQNPLSEKHRVLLVAGKRYSGTRAAIIAFLRHFRELTEGNLHDRTIQARVVEGIDLDSDGIIDEIEFRE